jgi:hypothetical protein
MASVDALEVDGVIRRIEHALGSAEVSGRGRRALQTQVFILQDLKLNASTDPAFIEGRIESRIAKLLLLQDVLCASNDILHLPQKLQLCIEDGSHLVRDACRALKTKVMRLTR